jgi:lysophospholipase L1-like esterase
MHVRLSSVRQAFQRTSGFPAYVRLSSLTQVGGRDRRYRILSNRSEMAMKHGLLTLIVVVGMCAAVGLAAEPAPKRENIEWTNIWIPDLERKDLPRVLLVGDSITVGYYDRVAQELNGKALVARLSTSSSLGDPAMLDQVRFMLSNYKFAVIHFNNGLHGFDYTDDQYRNDIPKLLKIIKELAPNARLILATTTPMRDKSDLKKFDATNPIPLARNKIVLAVAAKEGIPVDDLFSLVEKHPEYWSGDGVHFNGEGQAAQGKQVAKCVLDVLAK